VQRLTSEQIRALRRKILGYYRQHGRDLPFRNVTDPYKIAVAEIMLQQTPVERVLPKYSAWIARWPSWRSLAKAGDRQLLTMWSGLGYNRRALYLGRMAQTIVTEHGGELPADEKTLCALPGIGPYTSRAILIFAFNRPLVTVDTNVRRVLIHELGLPHSISAKPLERIAQQVLPPRRARDWHNALMDYGAMALTARKSGIKPLSRQSRFEGSIRQIRGEIVRQLTTKSRVSLISVAGKLGRSIADVRKAAKGLEKEGVVRLSGSYLSLKEEKMSKPQGFRPTKLGIRMSVAMMSRSR
jgi:A/G-specific adenine glycosylase